MLKRVSPVSVSREDITLHEGDEPLLLMREINFDKSLEGKTTPDVPIIKPLTNLVKKLALKN